MAKKFFPILIVLLSSFIAGLALLHPGFPPSHDGEYHIVRFFQFDKTLRAGQWYPRWQADLNKGYGSPLLNYYYPLPNYFASLFHFLGASFIDSFKLEMFAAIIVGGFFFFLWSEAFWGAIGGIVGAVLYTFSPYHFVDLYVRGSAGEVLALAFFPGFLWAITKVIRQGRKDFIIYSGILFALVILSHNILGYMFFLFSIFYVLFLIISSQKNKYAFFKNAFLSFLLSFGISAVFWMPALFERPYVRGLEIFNYSDNFPEAYQLLFPSWGTGFSSGDLGTEMSFQIGLANLLVVFLSFFVLIKFIKKKDYRSILLFFILSFFIVCFLMLKSSSALWSVFPLFNYFQFPWRFLSLATLIVPFLGASLFSNIIFSHNNKRKVFFASLLILFALLMGIGYAKPAYYHNRTDEYYFTRPNFMDGTNTPGNAFNAVWFNENLSRKSEKVELISGNARILDQTITPVRYSFSITANISSVYLVNTAYFPGWEVLIDNHQQNIAPNKDGLFSFNLPSGKHTVQIMLKNTPIRNLASLITLISVLVVLVLLAKPLFAKLKR